MAKNIKTAIYRVSKFTTPRFSVPCALRSFPAFVFFFFSPAWARSRRRRRSCREWRRRRRRRRWLVGICFPVTLFPWAITRTKIGTLGVLCVILEPAKYSSSLPNQRCIFCCFYWMWFVLDSRLRFCSAKWRSFVSDLLLLLLFFFRYSLCVWETDRQRTGSVGGIFLGCWNPIRTPPALEFGSRFCGLAWWGFGFFFRSGGDEALWVVVSTILPC